MSSRLLIEHKLGKAVMHVVNGPNGPYAVMSWADDRVTEPIPDELFGMSQSQQRAYLDGVSRRLIQKLETSAGPSIYELLPPEERQAMTEEQTQPEEPAKKHDIKETTEAADFVIGVLQDAVKAKADDGVISALEKVQIAAKNSPAAFKAIHDSHLIWPELRDVDPTEAQVLGEKFATIMALMFELLQAGPKAA